MSFTEHSEIRSLIAEPTCPAKVRPKVEEAFIIVLNGLDRSCILTLGDLVTTPETTLRGILGVPIPETSLSLRVALTLRAAAQLNLQNQS